MCLRFLFPFKLTASALELPFHFQYHVFNAMFHAVGSASARKRVSVIKPPEQVQPVFTITTTCPLRANSSASVWANVCTCCKMAMACSGYIYIYVAVVIAAANIVSSFSTSGPRPKLQQPAN